MDSQNSSRVRLDPIDRGLLGRILELEIDRETDMQTKALLVGLHDRITNPKPGHPVVEFNMTALSNAYYQPKRKDAIAEKRKIGHCEDCGLQEPDILEIDHQNCDRKDNSFENLRLLCPNCHRRKAIRRRVEAAKILGLPLDAVQTW